MISELMQKRSYTSLLSESPDWLLELLGSSTTAYTGETVTPTTALYNSAVYACVRILAETISTLPLIVYERISERAKRRATGHALYRVLHDAPNPEMTRTEMWDALVGHLVTWGNAYAEIERNRAYRPTALWPLRPDCMSVWRLESGDLEYEYNYKGTTTRLRADQVLHIRGLSSNGITGYSPITLAREAIGLSMATEEYGARFFANDSRPGGALVVPSKLSPRVEANLRTSWLSKHKGLDNAHRVAILEEGVTWQQIGIPPEDAQFLATRQFQVEEIARIFHIPPHMLADLSKATFSNIEHQSLEFVMHTIRPWLIRIEQRINQSLFTEREQESHFVEHLVDGLLRGDIKARYDAYATARQNGWMSANDIRELENQNPIEDGDIYLVPLNMVPADQAGQDQASGGGQPTQTKGARARPGLVTRATSGGADSRRRIRRAFRRLIEDATGRIVRREEADIMRQAEKMLTKGDAKVFLEWLREFYGEHPAFYDRNMLPVIMALAEQIAQDAASEIGQDGGMSDELEEFINDYTRVAGIQYIESNQGQLQQIVEQAQQEAEDPIPLLQARFDEWADRTPGKQAMIHSVRADGAVTKFAWAALGVRAMRWVTFGSNCPYCNALSGMTISITAEFLGPGDFQPEGAETPLTLTRSVGHPPAHLGCDCGLAPA